MCQSYTKCVCTIETVNYFFKRILLILMISKALTNEKEAPI